MKSVLSYKVKPDHYKADACIVWCFDDRFNSMLDTVRKHYKLKYVDEVKVAGGAKDLVHGERYEREYLLGQIEKSVRLHHTPLILLMVHHACGAYGKIFNTPEEEHDFYAAELSAAKKVIMDFAKTKGLRLAVGRFFASFDGLMELE